MWAIVSTVIQFVGYVFAFWLMWRLFDRVLHKAKHGDLVCHQCGKYKIEIVGLNAKLERSESRNHEKHRLDKIAEEAIAVGQINLASQAEIEEINGIGPVRAANIITHRPYKNWSHLQAYGQVSSCRHAVIKWAKERVGLNVVPAPSPWAGRRW
tara:strand:+ start:142 stop:603 length:462 start_codon:yes stop_codon:yes gene_type:complete